MHWCHDETLMLLAALPFVGFYFRRLRAWWCSRRGHSHAAHAAATARPLSADAVAESSRIAWDADEHVTLREGQS